MHERAVSAASQCTFTQPCSALKEVYLLYLVCT